MAINLAQMITLIAENDPMKVYEDLMSNNEEFKRFIERNIDKDTEQMITNYNLRTVVRDKISHV